jgi:hypothetical protein
MPGHQNLPTVVFDGTCCLLEKGEEHKGDSVSQKLAIM